MIEKLDEDGGYPETALISTINELIDVVNQHEKRSMWFVEPRTNQQENMHKSCEHKEEKE